MIKVIVVNPGKRAEIKEIDSSLKGLQEIVDGYIEVIYPFTDPSVCMICNEEGKLRSMEPNRALVDEAGEEIIDIIAGPFVICGTGEDDFRSLDDSQLARFEKLYRYPQLFFKTGVGVAVMEIEDSE